MFSSLEEQDKGDPTGALPYLYVNVNTVVSPSGTVAYHITVELQQNLRSLITGGTMVGTNWSKGTT